MHGRGAKVFTVTEELAPDSNLTIEILQRVLKSIDEKEHAIPGTIFLQLDNTSGQNKNQCDSVIFSLS